MLARASSIPLGYHHLGHTYPRSAVRMLWLPPSHRTQRALPLVPPPVPPALLTGGFATFQTQSRPTEFTASAR